MLKVGLCAIGPTLKLAPNEALNAFRILATKACKLLGNLQKYQYYIAGENLGLHVLLSQQADSQTGPTANTFQFDDEPQLKKYNLKIINETSNKRLLISGCHVGPFSSLSR